MEMNGRILRWEKPFFLRVARLSVPIMVQSLVLSLMHIVDNLMIGQLGEIELAGVTQANRITFLLQITMFGVVSGASVFTAQYWGKRDVKGIRGLLGLGLLTALCVAAAFAIPSVIVPGAIMGVLIQDAGAAAAGVGYLRIIGCAYLVEAVSMVYSAVLKSTEQVKLPMFASIMAIAVNATLNYLLIFGKFGMPKLGVPGAAIATLIGAIAELAVLLVASYRGQLATAAKPSELKPASRDMVRRYYRVVAPTMLNECFWSLGMVMYSVAYGRMGAGVVAAVSIFNNVEQLSSVMLRGTTHACAVLVGMAIGAHKNDDAQLIAKRMLLGTLLMALAVGALVALAGTNIVMLFNVSDQTRIDARKLIACYGLLMWIAASTTVFIVGVLRAGGDVRYAMFTDILPVWLIGIPLVFAFGPGMGWPIWAVYLLTRIEEVVKCVISLRRLRSGKWIHNLIDAQTQ